MSAPARLILSSSLGAILSVAYSSQPKLKARVLRQLANFLCSVCFLCAISQCSRCTCGSCLSALKRRRQQHSEQVVNAGCAAIAVSRAVVVVWLDLLRIAARRRTRLCAVSSKFGFMKSPWLVLFCVLWTSNRSGGIILIQNLVRFFDHIVC